MIISIVVAMAENNAIGKNNDLLWYLPTDLKRFKQITSGHTVIMGRKTFDSIGKPLPNRRNIVVTRNTDLAINGAEVTHTVDEALKLCEGEEEVFIVGGAEIYRQAMDKTNRIYLTIVHKEYEADAFFPEINDSEWKEVDSEAHQADDKDDIAYTFSTLERK